jgi:hypothetical protein
VINIQSACMNNSTPIVQTNIIFLKNYCLSIFLILINSCPFMHASYMDITTQRGETVDSGGEREKKKGKKMDC